MAEARRDLETVAAARVLFGHQSVGRDVLAGVASLARDTGVAVRIASLDAGQTDPGPGLLHANVGENGNPESKCQAFELLLGGPERPAYDVAALKFCYEDLTASTPLDVRGLLDRYAQLVARLRELRPDVKLVHVTLPLRADPPGRRAQLERLLRRPTANDADNLLRNAFNEGLRERFASEPVFDLAAVESTALDGTRSFFKQKGAQVYTLDPSLTHDGAHLNPQGQQRAAAAFLRTIATTLRRPAEEL